MDEAVARVLEDLDRLAPAGVVDDKEQQLATVGVETVSATQSTLDLVARRQLAAVGVEAGTFALETVGVTGMPLSGRRGRRS